MINTLATNKLINLSVITINFNNANGLQKTIESVINQTLNDFEYIVIDGGSTDGSTEILKKYTEQINYWISEPDNGIYNAMNKGVLQAHRQYCFFLNSGDYFINEEVLEKVFNNEFHEDVLFGNLLVCTKNKLIGKSIGKNKLTFLDVYSSLIKHQSSFIKRHLFDKFGLYNENLKIISDWEFFIKTIGIGNASYKYLDIDISYFDNNGISNHNDRLVEMERKNVLDRYIPALMQPDYEFLLKYGKYETVTKYRITRLILRIMAKVIKVLDQIIYKR